MGKKKKGQFALYIGFAGELMEGNTNEVIQRIIADGMASVSMVFVYKKYKGKTIPVLEVTSAFIEKFYAEQENFKLKFVVYAEINYLFQQFRLLEPGIKRPKQTRYVKTPIKK